MKEQRKLYICKIVRKILSIHLLLALLLQTLGSTIIVIGYKTNIEYITKNFCENRDKPKMHCNGKCHLNKVLKSEQKKEQNQGSPLKEKQETVQYFQGHQELLFSFPSEISKTLFNYSEIISRGHLTSVFHPPAV